MTDSSSSARRHYELEAGDGELLQRVRRMVDGSSGQPDEQEQLAAIDHFHVRGRSATAELAALAKVSPGSRVLDAGSGLGGPSRYLAQEFGCAVVGIDISPAFVEVARFLAARAGLGVQVQYQVGDLALLPFADQSFDLVWTEHAMMNVHDRDRAYRELRRVLRPGGTLAFHDVIAADGGPEPLYPAPWAESAGSSFLSTEAEMLAALERSALRLVSWDDVSLEAATTFARAPAPPGAGRGLGVVMGARFRDMATNLARNILEGRVRVVMGTAQPIAQEARDRVS